LAEALKHADIVDVEAIDGSQTTLPASAKEKFPSTSDAHGGAKLTAALGVLFQTINDVTLSDAKTHDRKALKVPRWMHGLLCLLDRGYEDHGLCATVKDFFFNTAQVFLDAGNTRDSFRCRTKEHREKALRRSLLLR
jgi:hypothetical protein